MAVKRLGNVGKTPSNSWHGSAYGPTAWLEYLRLPIELKAWVQESQLKIRVYRYQSQKSEEIGRLDSSFDYDLFPVPLALETADFAAVDCAAWRDRGGSRTVPRR